VIDTPWLFCTLIPSRVLDWTVKFWTPMLLLPTTRMPFSLLLLIVPVPITVTPMEPLISIPLPVFELAVLLLTFAETLPVR